MDSSTTNWQRLPTPQRCRLIGGAATFVARAADELVAACQSDQRTDPAETIASELLPLCSALKFIQRRGRKVLADRHCGWWGRPLWLWGASARVSRVPHGRVLVLGTWNYPVLLPGVQVAQALAGGNQVFLKPAPGTERASELLAKCFYDAGVPVHQLQVLDSTTEAAVAQMNSGVELVVLTGAADTGRKVLAAAATSLTHSIMELSGCDAAIVLPGADLKRVVRALAFGLRFNSGATCIGPRRLMVPPEFMPALMDALKAEFADDESVVVHPAARFGAASLIQDALDHGASDLLGVFDRDRLIETGQMQIVLLGDVQPDHDIASADVFAPVLSIMSVESLQQAIQWVNQCPYRLAASVFGPKSEALKVANQLSVGTVIVNDLIAPTADPRLPLGGRGESGFGVTRGAEGLLAMTVPRVVSVRKGNIAPHLEPRRASDQQLLGGLLQFSHGGTLKCRIAGLRRMVKAGKNRDNRDGEAS
ncbi:aldehyde dehydrogenase family protein [Stieleria varia]|uniref:aldehyde dehydrogenase family protein n=1 Tax=Stieleria varia TaxID=2528005 RepID=UPI0011B74376